MGIVCRALDLNLDREVAFEVLLDNIKKIKGSG
jgi:hypothetical protein